MLLFGATALFGKLIEISPGALVLGRAAIAAGFVTIVLAATGQRIRFHQRSDAALFILLGVTLAIHWTMFFQAVAVSSASIAVVSVSMFPIFTALLEPLVARRRPAALDIGLAVVAVAGVALIIGIEVDRTALRGVAWGSAAAALFAVLTVTNSRMVSGYSSPMIAWFQYVVASVVLVGFFGAELVQASGRDWILLLLFGIVFTGVAHTLFISSMQSIRSETASLMVSLEPIYGVILAWLVLGERPGVRIIAGGAIILSAVLIGSRRRLNQPLPVPAL